MNKKLIIELLSHLPQDTEVSVVIPELGKVATGLPRNLSNWIEVTSERFSGVTYNLGN